MDQPSAAFQSYMALLLGDRSLDTTRLDHVALLEVVSNSLLARKLPVEIGQMLTITVDVSLEASSTPNAVLFLTRPRRSIHRNFFDEDFPGVVSCLLGDPSKSCALTRKSTRGTCTSTVNRGWGEGSDRSCRLVHSSLCRPRHVSRTWSRKEILRNARELQFEKRSELG